MRLTAALAPDMVRRGYGQIVNVASITGYLGAPGEAVYSASKAGLVTFPESVGLELAGTGVGVTVVLPAAVKTDFSRHEGRLYSRRFSRLADPATVAEKLVAAAENGVAEVFVPPWLVIPARLHGAMPRLTRTR